jgi:xylose isomerase
MKTYFPEVREAIPYEGPDSKNLPLFAITTAAAWSRKDDGGAFEVRRCYWHTLIGTGTRLRRAS